ncbi:hypothetical protein B296_00005868 [Ensete ventricosum]|uniref:Uncharacterized protein n=1 Tax=Ensete ventricosum TaxID=4639 RepID=A0A427AM55_ENSVE|nr:hypothetical protein B296_00005868 [Ensete ventricosum]
MTSSDSSSSIRIVPSPGSGETGLGELEASSSGTSSGPHSPVNTRVLRDLEVMKVGHDLDMVVTEGSLAAIRERYNIPAKYELHVPWSRQRPYSLDVPEVCISVDALEVHRMDLNDLHGIPKVSGGKTHSVRAAVPAREVGVSPTREAPKTSSKRPTDTSTEQIDNLARRHKKVKILSRRHKSRHGEGGSRSQSKGKEPTASVEELETLVESAEEDKSPVFHRPRSMKDLFKMKV